MPFQSQVAVLAALLAGAGVGGCCTSASRAHKIERELRANNRLNAEPAMRIAARRLGAELLPAFPEELEDCVYQSPSGPPADCIEWEPRGSLLLRLRDAGGRPRTGLRIDIQDWTYARLARRGDDLILLVPQVIDRQVDRRPQCTCGAMPRFWPPGPRRVVFIVDGTPKVPAQQVDVPVIREYIRFDCQRELM